jgi:FlaA1/EpsC-like NDP-sugar epimerase
MDQIAEGGPVTVTHPDVTRYFLRLSEAVSLVLQAAALDEGGRVYMLDMGEPIRIVDLARDLIQVSGRTEDEISIVFTGLRPGEKLFEEISLEGERIHPTTHPRIVITEAPQPGPERVRQWLEELGTEPLSLERARVVELIRRLVPEYEPVREERVPAGE